MERALKDICASLKTVPWIGDGDTGYGNVLNVKRTVAAYAQAEMTGILIEDQVPPKRCGRQKYAVDARREGIFDSTIMARTDARATYSLEDAILRCQEFVRLSADITFLEAPRSVDEMKQRCAQVPGSKIANMAEKGLTPVLLPEQLHEIGYQIALCPVTLLSASIKAMENVLGLLRTQAGSVPSSVEESSANATPSSAMNEMLCDFGHVQDIVWLHRHTIGVRPRTNLLQSGSNAYHDVIGDHISDAAPTQRRCTDDIDERESPSALILRLCIALHVLSASTQLRRQRSADAINTKV
ncbi:Carboxyvinyl-carboxyphosphonate phosphorylmutase, partial [Globisporangium splendens]